MVDKILQRDMHVIIALRSKTEYVIEDNDRGRKIPRKIGTSPVFRDGIEYECSVFFDIAQDHSAGVTKDRTGLFDAQIFQISVETGKKLHAWLSDAGTLPPKQSSVQAPAELPIATRVDLAVKAYCKGMSPAEKEAVANDIKAITGNTSNYRSVQDEGILQQIYDRFNVKEDLK